MMAAQPASPFSDNELGETRAALAPTLEAAAAILPWINKPQPLRFPPELNERWQNNCQELAERWAERHQRGDTVIRPAIFRLLAIAVESGDIDCLRLGESLASVADRLEAGPASTRLVAAITATSEALREPNGMENSGFISRIQHFTQRLESSLQPSNKPGERSDVLDNLFVHDSEERVERMREALLVLPIDVYALRLDAQEMIEQAREIDMFGIIHLGRQLSNYVARLGDCSEEEQDRARDEISALLDTIAATLAAVNP